MYAQQIIGPTIGKNHKVVPSEEKGFTGDKWFDEKLYEEQMCSDMRAGGHDYYFGSYSNFYIHEEMLKDRIRTTTYQ